MGEVYDTTTITEAFAETVAKHGTRPFLAVPANGARGYLPEGFEITYIEAASQIAALSAAYRAAGYGNGHRVATLLENRPEYVLHKLALNGLGVCCVPINPDYRAGEIAYLLDHSKPDLVLALAALAGRIDEALGVRPPAAVDAARGVRRMPADCAIQARPECRADPRNCRQHPLYFGHHRAAEGLHTVTRL
jgi:acyl-CoA synthetase (AMP-forming)/AMP-acid ligase II